MNDAGGAESDRRYAQTLDARWDEELEAANEVDRQYSTTWAAKGPLLRAARETSLRRLFPFSAMSQVCFSSQPIPWEDHPSVAPAFVGLGPDRRYYVFRGDPTPLMDQDPEEVFDTDDPIAAARALAPLLEDWPG